MRGINEYFHIAGYCTSENRQVTFAATIRHYSPLFATFDLDVTPLPKAPLVDSLSSSDQ